MVKTTETLVTFRKPFSLRSIDTRLPAGTYRLITDEEEIDGLSFSAWRRLATMLVAPAVGIQDGTQQIFNINPQELDVALKADESP